MMTNKSNLRQALIAARMALAADVREEWNRAIGQQLCNWLATHPAGTLGVYWPIRNEPDLREIYPDLARLGVQLALPVVTGKESPLTFRLWASDDQLIPDKMGIPTPAASSIEVQPDAILVPCVGFNAEKIRLGYGGGFYDRTLATSNRPAAIGIAFDCMRVAFAAEAHDVALDVIITESGIV